MKSMYGYHNHYTLSTNDGEYHEGSASLSSFLPLDNTLPIRTLDKMGCIDSHSKLSTLCYGGGGGGGGGGELLCNVSGMLLVTLFILRQLVVWYIYADSKVAIQLNIFLHGKVCSKGYDVILTCGLIFIHEIVLYRPWNY